MPSPRPLTPRLTTAEAIRVAKRARRLLRSGRISHRQFVVLDSLLWSCRNPVTGQIVVSYSALQRLCHVSRGTIAGALAVLQRLGVLTRIKRRIRLAWHQGGTTSRQMTNAYVLHPGPDTEFGGRTVNQVTIVSQQAAREERRPGAAAVPDLLALRRLAFAGEQTRAANRARM